MKILSFATPAELFLWASEDFFYKANLTLAKKSFFDVALAGGSTAQEFFSILKDFAADQDLTKQCRFFLSDERVVPLDRSDSNAFNAWQYLLKPLGIDKDNFFPIHDGLSSAQHSARSYEEKLRSLLPLSQNGQPIFDLIYLGVGTDGHTASIFPHSKIVKNLAHHPHMVEASQEAFGNFERITLMPSVILNAKNICVMVTGGAKAKIIDDILHGPYLPELLPAQLVLRSKHPNLVLLTAL